MEKVWVLVCDHQDDDTFSVHTTKEGAEKALFKYVRERWDAFAKSRAFGGNRPWDMPSDPWEAVDVMFNDPGGEYFRWYISERTIEE